MQSAVSECPFDLGEIIGVGAFTDPEVAAARSDGDFLIRHQGDGADLHDLPFGQRYLLAKVKVFLGRSRKKRADEGKAE